MLIGVPAETRAGETRVAATPETVRKLSVGGVNQVLVQTGAGRGCSIPDAEFEAAGATLVQAAAEVYDRAELILKVRGPEPSELHWLRKGQVVIGLLQPHRTENLLALARQGVTAFALEWLPRISRAQSMDALSSQANVGGYKAVLIAANTYQRMMPMLMTAAGTVKAARVIVMGVGVAGLQAIATAKRLGAVVEATDVRPETKEQVESLGAKFIEVPLTEAEQELAKGQGGYARDMGEDYRRRQAALIAERIRQADIVITTALIPGRPAPVLVTEEMVKSMKPGSVIVDMAVEQGGNCPLSEPDKVVVKHGVHIVGFTNLPALVAADASALYARNLLNFLALLLDQKTGKFSINRQDEIVAGSLACIDGQLARQQ
ncbi:MAG TPA: Re/Si-specific NAD(P)(+) transhydrogenase subunit alpha [Burkholderiales bacterium]|jgi:NAD(P) transhydrogenase subunit alpha|nr:Re/Si-specific NAD(P)(+) transhydrogenase subunit alpha [Burkholderiales bacterium]